MFLKAKHALPGIIEVTNLCTNSQKTKVISNNLFQRFFSSNPTVENHSQYHENVVSLDPSDVEIDSNYELQKKPRSRRKLSDLEKKIVSRGGNKNGKFAESRNDNNLYKNIEKNEDFFRKCCMKLTTKNNRKKENKVLLDNIKIIKDAIASGFQPSTVFYTRASDLDTLNLDPSIPKLRVSYKQLQLWSDVPAPQGIVGLFEKPTNLLKTKQNNFDSIPLTIIFDDIRDPKNMGSMMRVAASVGCQKLLLTKGCVDIWNEKVIRAAAGVHFQFPYLYCTDWDNIENEISDKCKIFLADADSGVKDPENTSDEEMFCVKKDLDKNLPVETLYSTCFGKEDVAIIIGNESFGLSENAYLLAHKRKGSKVFIPLSNRINSLNSAVALGILVYEVKRQFEKSQAVSVSH